ncbi:Mov34/MPN/PAD-1 family protein [Bradyrhizobium sp.]|uniref:Mov34/MPN/PAD-1 family protein n=1 Tax=Bradyrhizobium sp. TaxID=376 RepID=UPI002DFF0585|nr:Mov34/MPN/PAD-1 family protein [Bradyrhizobium sp.]
MVLDQPATPPTILLSVKLAETVDADLKLHGHDRERGGILLGLRRGPHLHIDEATLPMRWDIGTMFAFQRSSRGHKELALRRWRQSHKTIDWVGEWHSHPERFASPSSIDIRSWRAITRDRAAPMAFLIIGLERNWIGLCTPDRDAPIRYKEVERSKAGFAFQPAEAKP